MQGVRELGTYACHDKLERGNTCNNSSHTCLSGSCRGRCCTRLDWTCGACDAQGACTSCGTAYRPVLPREQAAHALSIDHANRCVANPYLFEDLPACPNTDAAAGWKLYCGACYFKLPFAEAPYTVESGEAACRQEWDKAYPTSDVQGHLTSLKSDAERHLVYRMGFVNREASADTPYMLLGAKATVSKPPTGTDPQARARVWTWLDGTPFTYAFPGRPGLENRWNERDKAPDNAGETVLVMRSDGVAMGVEPASPMAQPKTTPVCKTIRTYLGVAPNNGPGSCYTLQSGAECMSQAGGHCFRRPDKGAAGGARPSSMAIGLAAGAAALLVSWATRSM